MKELGRVSNDTQAVRTLEQCSVGGRRQRPDTWIDRLLIHPKAPKVKLPPKSTIFPNVCLMAKTLPARVYCFVPCILIFLFSLQNSAKEHVLFTLSIVRDLYSVLVILLTYFI